MTVFIKNSTFCKSSHNLIYVNLYINQIMQSLCKVSAPFCFENKNSPVILHRAVSNYSSFSQGLRPISSHVTP